MKNINKRNRGTTFVLLLIIMLVVGLWIVTVADLTSTASQLEGRRVSFSMAVATADAGLERAFARYAELTEFTASIPTPAEMVDGWADADRAPEKPLNPGVSMDPEDVNILYIDGLGRIYRDDAENVDQMLRHNAYDAFNGRPVGRIGIVATATATVDSPVGSSEAPMSVTVNRIYNRNGLPFPSDLAFYTHTLYMHAGPDMYLDGPLYSSKRILGQTNSTTKIADDLTTPPNFPRKYDANGEYIGADAVNALLQEMKDNGRVHEIEGMFLNAEIHGIWKNQGNGVQLLDGVRQIQSEDVRYIYDTNNAEFNKWFGDNDEDGYADNAWAASDNPNINSGYREIIERRVPGQDETFFLSSQRMDNFADLKIYYDSSDPDFANADGTINPDKIQIYYKEKKHWDHPTVPSDPDAEGYQTAVDKAVAHFEAKKPVPQELKDLILKTMTFQPYSVTIETTIEDDEEVETEVHEGFFDRWLAVDHEIKHLDKAGQMNLVNFDVEALSDVLEDWSNKDIDDIDYDQFEYLPNQRNNYGEVVDDDLRGYVLYVSDDAADPELPTAEDPSYDFSRGIRLRNGSEVASGGLVVATDLLAYVEGDFNTGGVGAEVETNAQNDNDPSNEVPYNKSNTYRPGKNPSGLFADSIRLLSSVWDDDNSHKDISHRTPVHTTYNLAMVMGDRYTLPDETDTGGLHNFPRFLENWGSNEATISGAFVQLWLGKYNHYSYLEGGDWRSAYGAPRRHWRYDYGYYETGGLRVPLRSGRNNNSFGRYWMTAGN